MFNDFGWFDGKAKEKISTGWIDDFEKEKPLESLLKLSQPDIETFFKENDDK